MAEGNWNQPDPSAPVWASQWDYYQGAAAALQRGEPQAPPLPNPKELRRLRRGRKILGITFAVFAVWFAIGSINYAVVGSRGYLIGGLIFMAVFGLIARWALRSARKLRVLEAEASAPATQAPVAR